MTCPSCGLALPPVARFCARCGVQVLPARRAHAAAPVWLLVLLWVGGAGLLWVSAVYAVFAVGAIQPAAVGSDVDPASLRSAATLVAVCAGALAVAHVAAAVGLMTGRSWAPAFTTMVCVVWGLTCVLLPVALLGVSAIWRARRGQATGDRLNSRPSP